MIKVILIAGYLWIFVAHAERIVLNDGTGKVIGLRSGGWIRSQMRVNILTDILSNVLIIFFFSYEY